MPSPAIPHSKSAPDITSPHSPPNTLPSTNSFVTSRSAGSPLASSSPYYKGLTDFSLDINREKMSGMSPGRESRATSYVTSNSKSSFVVRVQGWGSSCFTSKGNEKSPYTSVSSWTKTSHENRLTTSSSSSSRVSETVLTKVNTKTTRNESESDKGKFTVQSMKSQDDITAPTMEKPLRERDSELPYMLHPPPPAQVLISLPPTPPVSDAPPTPPQLLYPSPPPAVQAPPPQTPAVVARIYLQ